MPLYWDNKALPHNFLIIYFIEILKKEKKNFSKRRIWTRVDPTSKCDYFT